ncbi:MAG: hypothetical protein ACI87E_000713 [Mariniblastus sp.]|jgi:hypothetical protein
MPFQATRAGITGFILWDFKLWMTSKKSRQKPNFTRKYPGELPWKVEVTFPDW